MTSSNTSSDILEQLLSFDDDTSVHHQSLPHYYFPRDLCDQGRCTCTGFGRC